MNATKYICHHCVGEKFLRYHIANTGARSRCFYCGGQANAFSIEEMADRIELAFEQHYRRTSEEPDTYERLALSDRESYYNWERHGDPADIAIQCAADISEDAARDIQQELAERHYDHDAAQIGEETEFDSEAHYEQQAADGDHWRRQWFEFDRAIKTQARFFGHNAKELLTEIFSNLEQLSAHDRQPLIVDIGPGTACEALHRTRVFQSEEPLKNALCRPDRELGPLPGPIAPAGRMNARGISVFYGATDPEVAIAEVRPPVRTRVVVAKFEILRPLRILDLRNLGLASADGSIFDEAFADLCHKAAFLQTLSKILCVPVVPDDEDLEHLATQALADFLATESDPVLDGIAYPSTQIDGSGYNVVLFHKAARVEETRDSRRRGARGFHRLPRRGRVVLRLRRHREPPPLPPSLVNDAPPTGARRMPDDSWWDPWHHRQSSLRVSPPSLTVHEISRVQVSSEAHQVSRWTRRETTTTPRF